MNWLESHKKNPLEDRSTVPWGSTWFNPDEGRAGGGYPNAQVHSHMLTGGTRSLRRDSPPGGRAVGQTAEPPVSQGSGWGAEWMQGVVPRSGESLKSQRLAKYPTRMPGSFDSDWVSDWTSAEGSCCGSCADGGECEAGGSKGCAGGASKACGGGSAYRSGGRSKAGMAKGEYRYIGPGLGALNPLHATVADGAVDFKDLVDWYMRAHGDCYDECRKKFGPWGGWDSYCFLMCSQLRKDHCFMFAHVVSNLPVFKFESLPVESGVCDSYPRGFKYDGVEASCFCKCMGNGKWENEVRGCLRAMYDAGFSSEEAHAACYCIAYGQTRPADWPPLIKLGGCANQCIIEERERKERERKERERKEWERLLRAWRGEGGRLRWRL
jgi:hypothetical protein